MKTTSNSLLAAALRVAVLGLFALVAALPPARAANANTPEYLTFQGYLTDGNGDPLGNSAPKNYDVLFRVFDDQSGGTRLWAEQQTVTVDKGYFSVLLGEGSDVGSEPRPAPSSLFANDSASHRFVEITVKGIGSGGSDSTILPRLRLLASPYAYLAQRSINAVNLINDTNRQVVSITGTNVGINKSSPGATLDVNGSIRGTSVEGYGTIPLGGIIMWSGSTVPDGWALCNSQTVNGRTTPDLRNRFIVGSGGEYTTGNTGGSKEVTLTTSQMPSHTHGVTDPGHGHNFTFHANESGGWNGGAFQLTDRTPRETGASEIHTSATGISNGNTGGGAAHENRPPYYALAFIMRVK